MNEQPDKWLDDLFRKSAEEFKPEFDPKDWMEMQKRLDDRDALLPLPWWKRMGKLWIWVGFLTCFVVGGYVLNKLVLTDEESGVAALNSLSNEYSQTKREVRASSAQPVTRNDGKTILSRSLPDVSGVRSGPVRSHSTSGSGTHSKESQKSGSIDEREEMENSQYVALKTSEGPFRQDDYRGTNLSDSVLKISPSDRLDAKEKEKGRNGTREEVAEEVEAVVPKSLTFLKIPWKNRKVEVPVVGKDLAEDKKENVPAVGGWAVRIGIAPDLSTVGMKNFSAPKTAWNVLLEYRIVPRLFVQSGITRSLKVYKAGKDDYRLPAGVKQSVYPSSVNGECTVLEVPLNVRYDFAVHERSNWFGSMGVSSYQMRKENYDYNYDKHYPGVKYGWSGETGWYWLSHLNASAGYEYKLGRNLSIVAEPYLRLPLKRVGYGKVNLITTGIWLSVRYTPAWRLR